MVRLEGWRYLDEELNIPYPWYTSTCLEWLKTIDLYGKRVFEFGVGDSTLWYRAKDAYCIGVEDNYDWAAKVTAITANNQVTYINTLGNICRSTADLFDIIVIDGSYRDHCLSQALMYVKKGGFIIIDNYKQPTADLADWPITEKLIENLDVKFYKEPLHEDWVTIVIHV